MARRSRGLNFRKKKRELNIPLLREIAVWILEIAIAVALAGVCVYFVGVRTTVVGQSMSEQLQDGDQVLINRFIYKVKKPKIGDVIVFLPNGNEKSHYYIKRVVAAGGDTIQIIDGVIYVNEVPLDKDYFSAAIADPGVAAEKIRLAADECFVIGDNPGGSEDSRFANIGNVKSEYIIGKAWFKILPFSDAGFVE
ncbi:MAG: signal peptidase I [bacterium]|nr:signal peptidase I [bacterium]MDY4098635.1 signal peptidase I [Lachnospiraceae bacterium]